MDEISYGMKHKRYNYALRMKVLFLVVVICMAGISVYAASAGPIPAMAGTQVTGTVNTGVTGLRVRTSTDTSSTANVITKVDGGFKFDILDTVNTSGTYAWYHVGFYLNGTYTYGYVTSQYVTIDAGMGYSQDSDFESYLSAQGFPDSYKEQLRTLHAEYPDWVFVADNTGKNWSDVVENENVLGRSLIYDSAKSSWKSTADGAFNWDTSEWYELDSGGWVQASGTLVSYALDPRNFLNDTNIFMFEDLSYNSSLQNTDGVSNVIAGTFMQSSSQDLSYDGTAYTYATGLMLAGRMSGVSPYHLATRIIQEQGSAGQGSSILGTVSGYEGFYNYYNQGAYMTSTASAVVNGLKYASATDSTTLRPWNTRMKSIIGGAIYIGSKYITRGQNTLYYEKFDLVSPYWHQYMTNILAARSESQTQSSSYSTTTKQNTALVFKIPVYNNMPDTACALPTGDGSPNDKLAALGVDGYSLTPTFTKDTTSYDLIVDNSVASVNVAAQTVDSTAAISGTGSAALSVGTNTVNVVVTAQNGDTKTYTITIVRKESASTGGGTGSGTGSTDQGGTGGNQSGGSTDGGSSSPSGYTTDYKLDSTAGTISKVGVGSAASDVLGSISFTGGAYGKILNADGSENSGIVGTGNQLAIYNSSGSQIAEYTFVIYGDLNGDGQIDVYDLIYMRRHLLGISQLQGAYYAAADTNRGNDGVDVYDLIYLRRHLLDIAYISQ